MQQFSRALSLPWIIIGDNADKNIGINRYHAQPIRR
jgi:hypothetical protein